MDKLTELTRLGEEQEQLQKEYEDENDTWWNGLTEKEREDAFYAVVKRIHQGVKCKSMLNVSQTL